MSTAILNEDLKHLRHMLHMLQMDTKLQHDKLMRVVVAHTNAVEHLIEVMTMANKTRKPRGVPSPRPLRTMTDPAIHVGSPESCVLTDSPVLATKDKGCDLREAPKEDGDFVCDAVDPVKDEPLCVCTTCDLANM